MTLDSTGAVDGLPAGVDLAVYRVVQESLTNVLKHGGPVAHVRVARHEDRVEVEVTDDGRAGSVGGRGAAGSEGGHGLLGMRERVALYGGTFEAVARPGGGFRVRASLPVDAGPS